jgi:hypothetical protein
VWMLRPEGVPSHQLLFGLLVADKVPPLP